MEDFSNKQEISKDAIFEDFKLGGEIFEAQISNRTVEGFFGKYEILVRKKEEGQYGDVAEVSPSYVLIEKERHPHRFFKVNYKYRGKGVAKWLLNKLKELDDEIVLDYVKIGSGLINFYELNGYSVQEKTKASIYTILKLDNYK